MTQTMKYSITNNCEVLFGEHFVTHSTLQLLLLSLLHKGVKREDNLQLSSRGEEAPRFPQHFALCLLDLSY